MKRKYDVMISIGEACTCTETLRKANLVHQSYPFDWNTGINVSDKVDIIVNDFKDFFNKEDSEPTGKITGRRGKESYLYIDKINKMHFVHDFPITQNFDEAYEISYERYQRRIKRFYDVIHNSQKTLLVFIEYQLSESPLQNKEDLIEIYNKLKEKFPNDNVDLMYIKFDWDIDFKKREKVQLTDNIYYTRFNYSKIPKTDLDAVVNYKLLIKAVKEYADLDISLLEKIQKRIGITIHLMSKRIKRMKELKKNGR